MGIALSVEKMSIEEKFQTMETIWREEEKINDNQNTDRCPS